MRPMYLPQLSLTSLAGRPKAALWDARKLNCYALGIHEI